MITGDLRGFRVGTECDADQRMFCAQSTIFGNAKGLTPCASTSPSCASPPPRRPSEGGGRPRPTDRGVATATQVLRIGYIWAHPAHREDPEEAPIGRPYSKRGVVWRPRSGSRSSESAGKDGGIDEDGGQKAGGARARRGKRRGKGMTGRVWLEQTRRMRGLSHAGLVCASLFDPGLSPSSSTVYSNRISPSSPL